MQLPLTLATLLLDPPTALLFGCAAALVSARLIAANPERETLRTALFGAAWGAFYAVCVGWFFFRYPDWMFTYLKDTREVALVPAFAVFLIITAAFGAFGALAAATLLRAGRPALAWTLTVLSLVTIGGIFWLQWDQYMAVGTVEQFRAGTAPALQSLGDMQLAMNVSGVFSGASAIGILATRFFQGRKAAAPKVEPRASA